MREQSKPNNRIELNEDHLQLLEELWVSGRNYQTALAKKKGMPARSTINVCLKQMESWGLVGYEEERPNKRIPQKWFKITELGKLWVIREEERPSPRLSRKIESDLPLVGAFYRQGLGDAVPFLVRDLTSVYLSPGSEDDHTHDSYVNLLIHYVLLISALGGAWEMVAKLMNEPEVWDVASDYLTRLRDFANRSIKYLEEVRHSVVASGATDRR